MVGLLLSILVQAGSQDGLISVQQEVSRLSHELGSHVTVAGPLGSNMLFVASHGVGPKVEASAVALALHASLVESRKVLVIKRTASDQKKLSQEREAERASWITNALRFQADERKRLQASQSLEDAIAATVSSALEGFDPHPPGNPNSVVRALSALRNGLPLLPSAILLDGVVRRLTPERLASIPTGRTQVFENSPTANAVDLPNIEDLLDEFAIASNRVAKISIPDQDSAEFIRSNFPEYAGLGKAVGKPAKVRLVVRSSGATGLVVSLEAFDEAGTCVGSATLAISKPGGLGIAFLPGAVASQGSSVWVPIGIIAANCARFQYLQKAAEQIPDWLLYPEKKEPLSVFLSYGLRSISDETPNACVVINVPEHLFVDGGMCVSGDKIDAGAVERMMRDVELMTPVAENQSVVWRSLDPEFNEAGLSDRAVMGHFARTAAASRGIGARSEGRLARFCGGFYDVWSDDVRSVVSPNVTLDSAMANLPNPFLRLIGAISDEDWDRLESGRTLTVGQLGVTSELDAALLQDPKLHGAPRIPDLYRHPSELVSAGRLEETPIRIESTMTRVGRLETTSQYGGWAQLKDLPKELRSECLENLHPKWGMSRQELEQFLQSKCRFHTGQRLVGTLVVSLPNGLFIRQPLPMPAENVSDQLAYDEMPQSLRDGVWQLFENDIDGQKHSGGGN